MDDGYICVDLKGQIEGLEDYEFTEKQIKDICSMNRDFDKKLKAHPEDKFESSADILELMKRGDDWNELFTEALEMFCYENFGDALFITNVDNTKLYLARLNPFCPIKRQSPYTQSLNPKCEDYKDLFGHDITFNFNKITFDLS